MKRNNMGKHTMIGTLSEWLTVGMATQLLGKPIDHTGPFYAIVADNGLKVFKIGATTFVNASNFVEAAGLPAGTGSLWPAELARLPMAKLYSRSEVAEKFNVSFPTVYKWAEDGKIQQISLEDWKAHPIYYLESVENDPVPIALKAFGNEFKISCVGGELRIDVKLPDDLPRVKATCFVPHPYTCWFTDVADGESYIRIEVHK